MKLFFFPLFRAIYHNVFILNWLWSAFLFPISHGLVVSLYLISESRIINSVRVVMKRWAKRYNFPTDKYFSVCF